MTEPLPWNHGLLVWEAGLDKRYTAQVHRTGDYTGMLYLFEGDSQLMEKKVGLSYRALFGPDIGDVAEWEEACLEFIDRPKESP